MGDRLWVLVLCVTLGLGDAFAISSPIARKFRALSCSRATLSGVGAAQSTLADQYPEIVEEIMKVERAMQDYDDILRSGRSLDSGNLLQYSSDQRRSEARRLYRLASYYEGLRPPPQRLIELLRSGAEDLQVSREQWNRVIIHTTTPRGRFFGVRHPAVGGNFRALNSTFAGVAGELFVAVNVEGFRQRGLFIHEIKGAEDRLIGAGTPDEDMERYLNKEIDVVFRAGQAWGEVKNQPFVDEDSLTRSHWGDQKTIYQQAQENAWLAGVFGKQSHAFFLNGISPGAAGRLRELGIIVHGEVDQSGSVLN